jgi:putative endonuclease
MIPVGYVYIVSNKSHRLYTGSTTNLMDRARQHRDKTYPNSFTARYRFDRLVYFEVLPDIGAARRRERQLKGWNRAKKVALIQAKNPNWLDLSLAWNDDPLLIR